jgi:hypothetical protein
MASIGGVVAALAAQVHGGTVALRLRTSFATVVGIVARAKLVRKGARYARLSS